MPEVMFKAGSGVLARAARRQAFPRTAVRQFSHGRPLSHAAARLSPDDHYKHALECNDKWCKTTAEADPAFFPACAAGQTPKILWLGCSDSRVPETTVLGLKPGEVFVHRNIANIMSPTDISMLSVVEYSVRHLKVETIVVCGHTSCGGVAATLGNAHLGVIDVWLQPMRALREKYAAQLAKLEGAEKAAELGRLNVSYGVDVIKRIPTVIEAIKERGLTVHGVIYDLASGHLKEVDCPEDAEHCALREDSFDLK